MDGGEFNKAAKDKMQPCAADYMDRLVHEFQKCNEDDPRLIESGSKATHNKKEHDHG